MIFYGNGEIWNPINRRNIVFKDGEFNTKDEQHIEFLKVRNYAYQEEINSDTEKGGKNVYSKTDRIIRKNR